MIKSIWNSYVSNNITSVSTMVDFQDIKNNWKGGLLGIAFMAVVIYVLISSSEPFTQERLTLTKLKEKKKSPHVTAKI